MAEGPVRTCSYPSSRPFPSQGLSERSVQSRRKLGTGSHISGIPSPQATGSPRALLPHWPLAPAGLDLLLPCLGEGGTKAFQNQPWARRRHLLLSCKRGWTSARQCKPGWGRSWLLGSGQLVTDTRQDRLAAKQQAASCPPGHCWLPIKQGHCWGTVPPTACHHVDQLPITRKAHGQQRGHCRPLRWQLLNIPWNPGCPAGPMGSLLPFSAALPRGSLLPQNAGLSGHHHKLLREHMTQPKLTRAHGGKAPSAALEPGRVCV